MLTCTERGMGNSSEWGRRILITMYAPGAHKKPWPVPLDRIFSGYVSTELSIKVLA